MATREEVNNFLYDEGALSSAIGDAVVECNLQNDIAFLLMSIRSEPSEEAWEALAELLMEARANCASA